jgi:hypothetical protein
MWEQDGLPLFYPTRALLLYEYDMKSGPCVLDKYNIVRAGAYIPLSQFSQLCSV